MKEKDFSKSREVQETESAYKEEKLNDFIPIEVIQAYKIKELKKEKKDLEDDYKTEVDYNKELLDKIKLLEESEKLLQKIKEYEIRFGVLGNELHKTNISGKEKNKIIKELRKSVDALRQERKVLLQRIKILEIKIKRYEKIYGALPQGA